MAEQVKRFQSFRTRRSRQTVNAVSPSRESFGHCLRYGMCISLSGTRHTAPGANGQRGEREKGRDRRRKKKGRGQRGNAGADRMHPAAAANPNHGGRVRVVRSPSKQTQAGGSGLCRPAAVLERATVTSPDLDGTGQTDGQVFSHIDNKEGLSTGPPVQLPPTPPPLAVVPPRTLVGLGESGTHHPTS